MNDVRFERRLVAIMAADVAGYSRLMSSDEEGTLARLTAQRSNLVDPTIARHRGRLVKTTGDGLLAEFASVVDAVQAACAIQVLVADTQADSAADQRISWRIGINVGDVMLQDGDIFGDGVNLAARLEALADPGGILVSAAVAEQIRGKLDITLLNRGERMVKNMPRPVRVFGIAPSGTSRRRFSRLPLSRSLGVTAAAIAAMAIVAWIGADLIRDGVIGGRASPPQLSIAVLPFTNLSGDPGQEWFADGITEDLITDLSRIANAFVIARNTSFTYKGKPTDIRQVGRELGVRYVLEGSVRRDGNLARVNAQLVDCETAAHVWAERFDPRIEDVFALQNEITGRIARALQVNLLENISRKAARGPPADQSADELAIRGWTALFNKPQTRETNDEAFGFLEQAIRLDERSSLAWAGLAYAHTRAAQFLWSADRAESFRQAIAAGERAVALDARSADARYQLAFALRSADQRQRAHAEMETCLQLNRNFAPCHDGVGFALMLDGRPREALPWIHQALKLSPRDGLQAIWLQRIAFAHILLGENETALDAARRAVANNPRYPTGYAALAAAAGNLGRTEDARNAIQSLRQLFPGAQTITAYLATLTPSNNPAYQRMLTHYVDGLRKAGMPE